MRTGNDSNETGSSRTTTWLRSSRQSWPTPNRGILVPGTGGLRKIRAAQRAVGRGKRGGVRVYYLDLPSRHVTHLLAIFGKREKSDLSMAERREIAALVGRLKKETS